MQAIYAFEQSKNDNLDATERFLFNSMEGMYDLYLLMLALLIEIHTVAKKRLELSRKKYLPTAKEEEPSKNFIENSVLQLLSNSLSIKNGLTSKALDNWSLNSEYPKMLFEALKQQDFYQHYLEQEITSYKQDREIIVRLYKEVIAPNDGLFEYIEESRITWVDDFPLVNSSILKTLHHINPKDKRGVRLSPLFKDEEDRKYAKQLFRKTVLNKYRLLAEYEGKTPNWDTNRIAEIDAVLIHMGISEFLWFPSIPVKVTINEYLEIAKDYSTDKSNIFINGILDKLIKEYQANDTLNKSGRGLL